MAELAVDGVELLAGEVLAHHGPDLVVAEAFLHHAPLLGREELVEDARAELEAVLAELVALAGADEAAVLVVPVREGW